MKRYVITAILILLKMNSYSQIPIEKSKDYLFQIQENYIRTYRIFPTGNMWYFIKLNTQTGEMWQIEFDQNKTKISEIPLNSLALNEEQIEMDNRFTLFPTQNNWTFLLLDQLYGKIWQVNWDTKPEKNEIVPLNNSSLIEEQKEIESRFTLYPTQNSWNFLLLDKIDGRLWQIRRSKKSGGKEIIPIQ
ncbi:hypothetical protein GCM10007103_11760 [Salinimicrobium marinum]|uniref:Uncharacterized protein n=1 Tax=Salinimicrobium marinum TaxID=680283 RepID=A0A918SAZ7_9FLAO|nr:hypothetical protein [Salinimicrobium marinum]GHA31765.1 hypothetical protein GCM10007103_11760 [Salinimicrobium marinum]